MVRNSREHDGNKHFQLLLRVVEVHGIKDRSRVSNTLTCFYLIRNFQEMSDWKNLNYASYNIQILGVLVGCLSIYCIFHLHT